MIPFPEVQSLFTYISRRRLARRTGAGILAGAAMPGVARYEPAARVEASARAAVDDIPVGLATLDYVDPEFQAGTNLVTYRDTWAADGHVWVGAIDPATGAFASGSGRDLLIDGQIPKADEDADNGPEWLRDDGVAKVLYTRVDGGLERMYLRELVGGTPKMIGPDDTVARSHCSGSAAATGRAKILYRRQEPSGLVWQYFWLDLADPTREIPLPEVVVRLSLPTWVDSRYILCTQRVGSAAQLALYDTASRAVTILTTDPDDKAGAYAWRAPELGGRLFYMAAVRFANQVDATGVRIYWRERPTDPTLTPYATLRPPEGSAGGVRSPEPFTYLGHSFISLALEPADQLDTSIWVFSVPATKDGPPLRPPQRVDDPSVRANKIDPEAHTTDARVFIYYYYFDPDARHTRLRRCSVSRA